MTWKVWLMAVMTVLLAAAYGFLNRADFITLSPQGTTVDLAEAISGEWDRVCILAPYTTNSLAGEILGTPLNVELRSQVYSSDSVALLVTMVDDDVDELYEVSRGNVDFAHLGGQCFPRDAAQFDIPSSGHPLATPEGNP